MERVSRDFGVLYLAVGRPYLAMALASSMSLRLTNPGVPFSILTDIDPAPDAIPWLEHEDRLVVMAPPTENRAAGSFLTRKPSMYEYARHARTLFIDADTLVLGDLRVVDESLRHFDIMARPYLERGGGRNATRALLETGLELGDVISCNTGVIGFRRDEHVRTFFATWSTMITDLAIDNDQPPFVPALYASPQVRFFPLPRRFNEGAPSAMETEDIAILHYKRRGDGTTRRLVEDLSARVFGDSHELRGAVQKALEPGKNKLRQRAYRRSRNQDRLRPSIVAPIRRAAEERDWL